MTRAEVFCERENAADENVAEEDGAVEELILVAVGSILVAAESSRELDVLQLVQVEVDDGFEEPGGRGIAL